MENIETPVSAAPAAPMQPAPMAAPVAAPAPVYSEGGSIGSSIKGFFSDINLVDIAISAFIVAGVIYSVHYYKYMMLLEKSAYRDLSDRLQKVESAALAQKKTEESMNASGNNRRRPIMRLG